MDVQKLKVYGYAAFALLATGGLSYYVAAENNRPPITRVSSVGCGVPATTVSFGLPMRTLAAEAPTVPVRFGPIEIPEGGGLMHLKFDPTIDGTVREVAMSGDEITLPFTFGRDGNVPERIVATCRNGGLANIRYSAGNRSSASFGILAAAETAGLASDEDAGIAGGAASPDPTVAN
ncbi:MAG TPA: hypothetical protein VFO41_14850 [Alphaproteobacteria bacterium]|nr:hypothetical protein [Alphaproteobacteria bacterium]